MSSEVHQTSLLRPVWWDIGDGKSASRKETARTQQRCAVCAHSEGERATTLRQEMVRRIPRADGDFADSAQLLAGRCPLID
jgi:hypothetical protein